MHTHGHRDGDDEMRAALLQLAGLLPERRPVERTAVERLLADAPRQEDIAFYDNCLPARGWRRALRVLAAQRLAEDVVRAQLGFVVDRLLAAGYPGDFLNDGILAGDVHPARVFGTVAECLAEKLERRSCLDAAEAQRCLPAAVVDTVLEGLGYERAGWLRRRDLPFWPEGLAAGAEPTTDEGSASQERQVVAHHRTMVRQALGIGVEPAEHSALGRVAIPF